MRRVADWTEFALPGVADGHASALALSKRVSGQVIWAIVQTTASVVGIAHYKDGRCQRCIEFADGSWRRVEGEPQPWEALLFSAEELEAAKDVGVPGDNAELEVAFASKTLEVGKTLPWPREWETLRYAISVTEAEWEAAQVSPPVVRVEGRGTLRVTYVARIALFFSVGCLVGLLLTRDGGFAGLAVAALLVALGAGFLRRAAVGRWFL